MQQGTLTVLKKCDQNAALLKIFQVPFPQFPLFSSGLISLHPSGELPPPERATLTLEICGLSGYLRLG